MQVLIHEATMENDLEEMALQKRHSTTAEAVGDGLAVRMTGHCIVLWAPPDKSSYCSTRLARIR